MDGGRGVTQVAERAAVQLAGLLPQPGLREAWSWSSGLPALDDRVIGHVEPGDADALAAARGDVPAAVLRAYAHRAAHCVHVLRDVDGRVLAFGVVVAADDPAVEGDPALAAWVQDCRRSAALERSLLWRGSWLAPSVPDQDGPRVSATVRFAATIRAGGLVRGRIYVPVHEDEPELVRLMQGAGAQRRADLDETRSEPVMTWVLDLGDEGLLGRLVTLGTARAADKPPAEPDAAAVRDALRAFHDPVELASSPFASGEGTAERAAAAQRRLLALIDDAFGDAPGERVQRELLRRAYVERGVPLEALAPEFHVSRRTFFRRLRAATERVAQAARVDRL